MRGRSGDLVSVAWLSVFVSFFSVLRAAFAAFFAVLNALFKARFDGGNELPGEIQPKHFSSELALAPPSSADTYVGGIVDQMAAKSLTMSELSQRIYAEALRRSDGRVSTAARMLGVTRPQFVYRARGIESGN